MKLIGSYINGNYRCSVYEDGTKVRSNNLDSLIPNTAESIDLKITNRCDRGCAFCHEDSTCSGEHADLLSPSFLDNLHPFTEIAIGGGNPLSHPGLVAFLYKLKELQCIPSMTVHQYHFQQDFKLIKSLVDNKLIYGVGISLVSPTEEFIDKVKQIPNAVIHVINGIVPMVDLKKLSNQHLKILILGYKNFRRGADNLKGNEALIQAKQDILTDNLQTVLKWFDVVSFDNLAIEQLKLKDQLTDKEWKDFYMGGDGEYTMFVDMVKREYALNSCSEERFPIKDTLEEMFKTVTNKPAAVCGQLTLEELNEIFLENFTV